MLKVFAAAFAIEPEEADADFIVGQQPGAGIFAPAMAIRNRVLRREAPIFLRARKPLASHRLLQTLNSWRPWPLAL